MSGACIAVFFDALGASLYDTVRPEFLASVGAGGAARQLTPSFGFCEYSAAFLGLDPATAGHLTLFRFTRRSRAFHWLRAFGPVARIVPRRAIAAVARRLDPDLQHIPTAQIPQTLLPRLEIVELRESFWRDPRNVAARAATCTESAIVAGPRYWSEGEANIEVARAAIDRGARFVVLHLPDLDALAHRDGPGAPSVVDRLRRLDARLAELVAFASLRAGSCDVVAFGDHGMVRVQGSADATALLTELGPSVRRGACSVFLDSTMIRVRTWDARETERVRTALARVGHGRVLEEHELRAWGAWFPGSEYGDVIFLADPGYVVMPNFFQGTTAVAGMHGYAPGVADNLGQLVSSRPVRASEGALPLHAVYDVLVDWLDAEYGERVTDAA